MGAHALTSQIGAADAIRQPQIIFAIGNSLLSQHPQCRKVAAEILVFFCLWDANATDRVGLSIVIRTFEHLETQYNSQVAVPGKVSKFERWLRQTEEFAASRGRMGSTVGAQQLVRGMDAQSMTDYCVSGMRRQLH